MKKKLNHRSTLADLASSGIVEELLHSELIVWMRIVRARALLGSKVPINWTNEELHRTPRVAARALVALQGHGLIRIKYGYKRGHRLGERTLELL